MTVPFLTDDEAQVRESPANDVACPGHVLQENLKAGVSA
jgi:hypothetical protein